MQGTVYNNNPGTGTAGLPKGTYWVPTQPGILPIAGRLSGGNGVVVVPGEWGRAAGTARGAMNYSTKAGQGNLASRGSVRKETPTKEIKNLSIKTVANFKNLVSAYESIKSKPGNSTPGVDGSTLDGMDKKFLLKTQESLRAGKFEFPPARRISIPKPGKPGETRPLTIAAPPVLVPGERGPPGRAPRDKVVQKAILLVLERYFDPLFLESSHGFRPGRGTHTATKYLEAKFQSVKYIIEADFSKAFDSINHDELMTQLAHHITDDKLLKVISSGLKSG